MLFISVYMLMHLIRSGNAFLTKVSITPLQRPKHLPKFARMSTTSDVVAWSWSDLQTMVGETSVGTALNEESRLRLEGKGSAHVQNKLRKFDSDDEPVITLFRDHAGWYADSTHSRFDGTSNDEKVCRILTVISPLLLLPSGVPIGKLCSSLVQNKRRLMQFDCPAYHCYCLYHINLNIFTGVNGNLVKKQCY